MNTVQRSKRGCHNATGRALAPLFGLSALAISGCVAEDLSEDHGVHQAAVVSQPMIIYRYNDPAPPEELYPLGSAEDFGGNVISGDPEIRGRIDYDQQGMVAGIFETTTGHVRVRMPFTEHATILAGEVTIVDRSNNHVAYTLGVGDSYLIEQGTSIDWIVEGDRVQKSFHNFTEPNRPPGHVIPVIIHRFGQTAPESELEELDPLLMGGVPIGPPPEASARTDYAREGMSAGIFQATTGRVLINFPSTEHMTVLDGEVFLTDVAHGVSATLRRGDSYFIERGSVIDWDVRGVRMQKTFFNYAPPM